MGFVGIQPHLFFILTINPCNMKHNPNKAISANSRGITISYTDTCKHFNLPYEKESILNSIQLHGNKYKGKFYQNKAQQQAYRVALYGLSVFTPEEVKEIPFLKKAKITNNQQKVQQFLDKWKQEICHQKLGSFLTTFFSHSKLASELANYDYYDSNNKNKLDFKELGITKDMIVKKLILAKLLPNNYYELK